MAFASADVSLDWEGRYALCPPGNTSLDWKPTRDRQGHDVIRMRFWPSDGDRCPVRSKCVASKRSRTRFVRPQPQFEALPAARRRPETEAFRERYARRAGGRRDHLAGAASVREAYQVPRSRRNPAGASADRHRDQSHKGCCLVGRTPSQPNPQAGLPCARLYHLAGPLGTGFIRVGQQHLVNRCLQYLPGGLIPCRDLRRPWPVRQSGKREYGGELEQSVGLVLGTPVRHGPPHQIGGLGRLLWRWTLAGSISRYSGRLPSKNMMTGSVDEFLPLRDESWRSWFSSRGHRCADKE